MADASLSAFDFNLTTLDGKPLPLSSFAGRPMVVVNTASKCGFTPQYKGLQKLWDDMKDQGLVVLGVPSNDFGNQEPGDSATIGAFCEKNYGVSFPLASKVHVRGGEADPFFQWLSAQGGYFARPRWNFYKYLIGKDGKLHDWFGSITSPDARRFRSAVQDILR
jgi:glutathione peroxidase